MSDAPSQTPPTGGSQESPETGRYTAELANKIETRWQGVWDELGIDRQPNPGEKGFDASKPKFYCLDMFPYPSGAGLHVGHPEGYTATDIICRYKRMRGFNVLHPMGWDAFGLPAEQHAINTGEHPASFTRKTIANFKRQLKRFGFCYDWSREFATIDEGYYKWTQWIFLQIYGSWFDAEGGGLGRARPMDELVASFASGERTIRVNPDASEHDDATKARTWDDWGGMSEGDRRLVLDSYRLAYIAEQTVNWCPKLGTVLANEEVIDGRSERGGHPVFRKPMRQWLFRITSYAERLLADLPLLDWPESTRTQQAEWIGRSEGAELFFTLKDAPAGFAGPLTVYTTRPDTVFGVSAMVVAPEHPLVEALLADGGGRADLRAYVEAARNRSDVERQEAKEKTGVDTGLVAVNPASGEAVPVWCADYVLMGYGTGAIMMVPAHDERDYAFAKTYGLKIRDVVCSLPMLVVRHYAKSMEHEAPPAGWRKELGDLLGLVITSQLPPAKWDEALHTVRTRRVSPQRSAEDRAEPGAAGRQRGVIADEWVAFVGTLGFEDPAELAACVLAGRFRDHTGSAWPERGYAVHSSSEGVSINGLSTAEAKARTIDWAEDAGVGRRKVNYRLRDWLFSRQRYWGEPFPIVFDEAGHHHAVSADRLPVTLPELQDYHPAESEDPQPLLGKATDWVHTTAGDAGVGGLDPGARVTRETNTMPGWAGSCWYELRYCDAGNTERLVSREAERYWMLSPQYGVDRAEAEKFGTFEPHMHRLGGVDLYVGGAEHAVLHLLYARFWHKVLFDLAEVSTPEPFHKLFHQGLITSYAFQRADRTLVPTDEVENRGTEDKPVWVETATGKGVTQITAKMSKSLRNVVNPDDVIAEYGADTFRLYEMYMGPLEASKPWNTRDIIGQFRFCQRVWANFVGSAAPAGDGVTLVRTVNVVDDADLSDEQQEHWAPVEKQLHRAIAKVGADIERLSFNTAIAAMIELNNELTKRSVVPIPRSIAERFCQILAPFAPHLAEELWSRIGLYEAAGSVHAQAWPGYDESMLRDDEVEIPVQIMGKVRSRVTVPADADEAAVREAALADERVVEYVAGKTIRKVIYVPGRLINIVAN